MVIPHYIINYVLSIVSQVMALVSWLIIVVTGKLPEGIANFQIMALRYAHRMNMFLFGLTEDYPPFTFDTVASDPGDYSIQLSIQPQLEGRSRLTVFFRLFMIIPLAIVAMVIFFGVAIVALIAWFAVLFTGTYPAGMRNFVIGAMRYGARVNAYAFLLTDEYPPFNLDE